MESFRARPGIANLALSSLAALGGAYILVFGASRAVTGESALNVVIAALGALVAVRNVIQLIAWRAVLTVSASGVELRGWLSRPARAPLHDCTAMRPTSWLLMPAVEFIRAPSVDAFEPPPAPAPIPASAPASFAPLRLCARSDPRAEAQSRRDSAPAPAPAPATATAPATAREDFNAKAPRRKDAKSEASSLGDSASLRLSPLPAPAPKRAPIRILRAGFDLAAIADAIDRFRSEATQAK